jgi:DNA-binding transcriptional LysR family regulator
MISLREANTEDIVSMVENNVVDLGIVEGYVNNKNLTVEECKMDQLVVIMPNNHPLAAEKEIHVKELVAHPFISREQQHGDHDLLEISFELSSPEAIKGAVEAGMGISIVSRATILKELKLKSLTAVNLSPKLERPFSFVRQRYNFKSRAADELLSFAQEFCKKM